MRQRIPAILVLAALCAVAACLWLTRHGLTNKQKEDLRQSLVSAPSANSASEMAGLNFVERSMVEAFAAQPSGKTDGAQPELIPEEWEGPLFDVLLDEKQTMDQRNARLIEMATGPAKGVPSVQEECVMHLLFGLPDDGGEQFLAVATNTAIPVGMRAEFLKQALEMRPQELGEWLSGQLINHHEPAISGAARLYLLDLRISEQ